MNGGSSSRDGDTSTARTQACFGFKSNCQMLVVIIIVCGRCMCVWGGNLFVFLLFLLQIFLISSISLLCSGFVHHSDTGQHCAGTRDSKVLSSVEGNYKIRVQGEFSPRIKPNFVYASLWREQTEDGIEPRKCKPMYYLNTLFLMTLLTFFKVPKIIDSSRGADLGQAGQKLIDWQGAGEVISSGR